MNDQEVGGGWGGGLRHLQDDIGRTHRSAASSILELPKGTSYLSLTHTLCMFLSRNNISTHPPAVATTHTRRYTASPRQRGCTWPNTPAASDWLQKASNTPPLPSQRDSAWKQRGCYHYRPLPQRCCHPHPRVRRRNTAESAPDTRTRRRGASQHSSKFSPFASVG